MLPHVKWWNGDLNISVLFHFLQLTVVRSGEERKEFGRNVPQSQIGLDRMRIDNLHNLVASIPCGNCIAFNFDSSSGKVIILKSGWRNVSLSNYDLSTCPLYDLIDFFASFTDDMHSDRARNLYLQF